LHACLFKTLIYGCLGFCSPLLAQAETVQVLKAKQPITIDGKANEDDWLRSQWWPLDKHILGENPQADDFSGRYKLLWEHDYLYLLAEITDDMLFDQFANPLERYWDDDCLEVFIDEDASGGEHQFNFNAFAYHIALDNQVADIGPNNADGSTNFVLLNEHVNSRWLRVPQHPNNIIWELAISIYDETFTLPVSNPDNKKLRLNAGKTLGFMLAYCDNDGSKEREHFIGSHSIKAVNGDKNLGYIDASVFGKITLVNKP